MSTTAPGRTTAGLEVAAQLHERLAAAGTDVPLRLWDGRILGPSSASYRVVLRAPWALRALVTARDDLAVAETYLADGVDVEGSMVEALRALRSVPAALRARDLGRMAAAVARLPRPPAGQRRSRAALHGRRHSQRRDAIAVRHHYDQDVAFFRTFLDPELVYSCAYFGDEDAGTPSDDPATLAAAQRRKLELVCRKLDLRPDERLLDVGCGWGAFVLHAARYHGVHATGITLSEPQAAVARERVAQAGLEDRVRVEVADYREVRGRFDAIASIGMVEHVGADRLPAYARALRGLLDEGGRLLNHGITTGARGVVRDLSRDRSSFVARYVFPDGALVPAHRMAEVVEQSDFEVWDVEQLRPHYARTLEQWVANLERNAADARRHAGEQAYRVWRAYMAGSVLGFASNDLGVIQVLATAGRTGRLPFSRDRVAVPDLDQPGPRGHL